MNKKEILIQAQAEGIELSAAALNRYISHGLMPSQLHSSGYKGGVQADYPDAMINIRFISQARQDPRLGHQKHLLPYLFWNGYQVRTEDLHLYLLEYQQHVQETLQQFQNEYEDEIDLEWFLDLLSQDKDIRAARPPGRPSMSQQTNYEDHDQAMRAFNQQLIRWMLQIALGQRIPAQEVIELFVSSEIRAAHDMDMILQLVQSFMDHFHWLQPEESIDWSQLMLLSETMRSYSEELDLLMSVLLPRPVANISEQLQTHPRIVPLILLLLTTSHQIALLQNLVSADPFRAVIKQLIKVIKGGNDDA